MLQTFRKIHRWFGAVSAIFMLFIGITGFVLQVELWIAGKAPPGRTIGPAPVHAPIPDSSVTIEQMVKTATDRLRAEFPEGKFTSVAVNTKNGIVSFTGSDMDGERATRVNGRTGEYLAPKPTPEFGLEYIWTRDWHYIMQDLHAGYYFGLPGRIISCLLAISLIMLSITGLQVYLDMYGRRKKQGRKGLFW